MLFRAFGKAIRTILTGVAIFGAFYLMWIGLNYLFTISIWLIVALVVLIIVGLLTSSYYHEMKHGIR